MSKKLLFLAAATLMIFAAPYAMAEPQYDDAAWEKFFDKPSKKVPKGLPTGKGCLSNFNPTQVLQVSQPYDLSKDQRYDFAHTAVMKDLYFASQTQKDFLEATSTKLRNITQNDAIQIPIGQLTHDTLDYPVDLSFKPKPMLPGPKTVHLGWFGTQDGKPIAIPGGTYVFKTNKIHPIGDVKKESIVKKYQALCQENQEELKKLSFSQLIHYTEKLYENAQKSCQEIERARIAEMRKQNIEKYEQKREANKQARKERQQQREQAREERRELLEQAREERREAYEIYGGFEEDIEAESDELWVDLDPIERRKNALQQKKEEREAQRELRKKEQAIRKEQKKLEFEQQKEARKIYVDIPMMWALLEAALTQDKVPVASISLPRPIEELVVLHGKKLNKPQELLNRILALNKNTKDSGPFSLTLACSLRDRYLGCQDAAPYRDQKLEDKIVALNKILEKQVKSAKSPGERDRLSALISNAIYGDQQTWGEEQRKVSKQSSADEDKRRKNSKKDKSAQKLVNPIADLPF